MTPTEKVSKGTSLFVTILIAALVAMVMGGVTAYFSQHVYTAKVQLTTP